VAEVRDLTTSSTFRVSRGLLARSHHKDYKKSNGYCNFLNKPRPPDASTCLRSTVLFLLAHQWRIHVVKYCELPLDPRTPTRHILDDTILTEATPSRSGRREDTRRPHSSYEVLDKDGGWTDRRPDSLRSTSHSCRAHIRGNNSKRKVHVVRCSSAHSVSETLYADANTPSEEWRAQRHRQLMFNPGDRFSTFHATKDNEVIKRNGVIRERLFNTTVKSVIRSPQIE
jgi:hypothetical protein